MKLVADLDKHKHAYLNGQIICVQVNNFVPLHFLVNTGSTYTTILGQDTFKLGINIKKLLRAKCWSDTAKGQLLPYELPNVKLRFETDADSEESPVIIPLEFIQCLPPPKELNSLHPLNLMFSYSLLGMDVLKFFKRWQYTDTTLTIET